MLAKAAASNVARVAPPAPLRLDALELRLVRLPLLEPFEVSFGRMESRLLFLLRLEAGGHSGWGECVAWETPLYSYETVGTARHVIRDYLAPAILGTGDQGPGGPRFTPWRLQGPPHGQGGNRAGLRGPRGPAARRVHRPGHRRSARQGRGRGEPGHPAHRGRPGRAGEALPRASATAASSSRSSRAPTSRWWSEIRRRHPRILLSVDANAAYTLADAALLRRLDAYDLLMIEQPLAHDDLVDHAKPAADPGHRDLSRREHHEPRPGPPGSRDRRLPHRQHEDRTRGRLQRGAAHPRPLRRARRAPVVRRDARVGHRSRAQRGPGQPSRLHPARGHLGQPAVLRAGRHRCRRWRWRRTAPWPCPTSARPRLRGRHRLPGEPDGVGSMRLPAPPPRRAVSRIVAIFFPRRRRSQASRTTCSAVSPSCSSTLRDDPPGGLHVYSFHLEPARSAAASASRGRACRPAGSSASRTRPQLAISPSCLHPHHDRAAVSRPAAGCCRVSTSR